MIRVRAFVGIVLVFLCFSLRATTFTVTSASSNGPGTFSEAITLANANPGPDVIAFSIGSGPVTILLTNPLPVITGATAIDGSTQPGYAANPLITIDANGFLDCLEFVNSAL